MSAVAVVACRPPPSAWRCNLCAENGLRHLRVALTPVREALGGQPWRRNMKLTNAELDEILDTAGLRMNQPYNPRGSYRKDEYIFTACKRCGTEAHYRLKYILDKNASCEPVCRACHWIHWYSGAHALYDSAVRRLIEAGATRRELIEQGVIGRPQGLGWEGASQLARAHGYDLVDLIEGDRPGDDVMVVRCRACGRQTAERPGDVEFGCSCGGTGPGVQYGQEAKAPETPLSQRKVAPRTPGAASMLSQARRHAENPPAYGPAELEGKTVADFPELLEAWDEDVPPEQVPVTGWGLARFRCPNGHHPNQTPYSYLTDGCTVCRGLRTKSSPDQSYLRDTNPELSEEWLEAMDGPKFTPENVKSGSRRKVRWRCIACGHEWCDTVRNRELRMNNRCPSCGKVMGSLAWQYPAVARCWSPKNPVSPWNIKPHSQLDFKPEWVCPDNPEHTWSSTVATMIKRGGKCPYCGE